MTPSLLKCVIWDLDGTLWDGILAEGDAVTCREGVAVLIRRLDAAGIVQSLASKNDPEETNRALARVGLADVFVCEEIGWRAKSESVERIVTTLRIGYDSVVFVDDSPFERAEVSARLPAVTSCTLAEFVAMEATQRCLAETPTGEAANRPRSYRAAAVRQAAEAAFEGTPAEFLATLEMILDVRYATTTDLERSAELTMRTNQLNTSGRVFSIDELHTLIVAPESHLLIAELTDRFGDYGRIGLIVAHRRPDHWLVELLLLSCRVMGRNLAGALLGVLGRMAATEGVPLRIRYRPNGRNRQMQVTCAFLGFTMFAREQDAIIYEHASPGDIRVSGHITIRISPEARPIAPPHGGPGAMHATGLY